jgi:hypothetical protein
MHPFKYGWLEIETISLSAGHNSIDHTASEMARNINDMSFVKTVAFVGIKAGYDAKSQPCPFASADEMVKTFEKFAEAMVYFKAYTTAVMEFFKTDEPVEDTKKKGSQ